MAQPAAASNTIDLALFLWRRIRQIGIQHVFGVPGDFNLALLDYIYKVDGLNWVGDSNELNAAYAADGYARAKCAPGCLVTTHGVGELSAINGVAGSMSENVPVIHIVGQISRPEQKSRLMIHHSIGREGEVDHSQFVKLSTSVRCAAAQLWDAATAAAEIDRVLRACFLKKLPVYIYVPSDMVGEQVDAAALEKPVDIQPPVDVDAQNSALKAVEEALTSARAPGLLVDSLVLSHAKKEAQELAATLSLPTFAAPLSKSVIDEHAPYYRGPYRGSGSTPAVIKAVEAIDLMLVLGWFPSNVNTGIFTRAIPVEKRIDVQEDAVIIRGKRYENVYMAPFIKRLLERASHLKLEISSSVPSTRTSEPLRKTDSTLKITQKFIWPRFSQYIQSGDILLADTGTSSYGLGACEFPSGATYMMQSYWSSIGWATPAALGVELASREVGRAGRTLLVTGDGSISLTIQAVGTMVARGVKPVIVIINNAGYTIERAIRGAKQTYNDIAPLNFKFLLAMFGGEMRNDGPNRNYRAATTIAELEAAWQEPQIQNPTEIQVLEVFMDPLDVPPGLAKLLIARFPGYEEYFEKNGFTYT